MMGTLAVTRPEVPSGLVAIPVRTRLVAINDDLMSIVEHAVHGIARPGDVIAISETAVAIAQGEFVPAEYVRPSKLAYALSRRAGALATVNQPESLQLVIDQVGPWKVAFAAVAHVLGRLRGRRGVFYEVMGEAITAIDGYTGTLPPYERAIVFAPREPDACAQSIFERTGVACVIVDANDLEKAKVLGASGGVCRENVERALLDNPHGNGDEQTPIVVLKWRSEGTNPLFDGAEFALTYAWMFAPLAVGFLIAFLGGAGLLPALRHLQFRQHAYEDAPESHRGKTGTPTMGGILFGVALLPLIAAWRTPFALPLGLMVLACGAVGFVDDLLAIRRGRNLGLRARTKYLATALISIVFLRALSDSYNFFPRDVLFHAGKFSLVAPHWLWLLLGILAVTGTIHAVNLTDGLDGLATGTMLPPLAVLAAIAFELSLPAAMIASLLGIGACLGFLVYNRYPAKMFMGDTGSLALGALLSGVAILEGEMLLLILVGAVFVAEALSVILQVGYFKATRGKRIFRMSPLHHHFELGGWPETKVTARFWFASLLCSLLGWVLVR